jgi:hypothetical protein
MPAGLQIYGTAGELRFDSTTAKGGVFIDTLVFAPGSSGVLTFPDFAGATPILVDQSRSLQDVDVTTDTSLGYPRITVTSTPGISFTVILK